MAVDPAMEAAQAAEAEARAARAAAFNRNPNDPSTFVSSSNAAFSAEAINMARTQPAWILSAERHLEAFLTGDARRESLPPMTRPQRAVVHELAKNYGIATASYGDEPRRHVDLFRSANAIGACTRLSDIVRAMESGALGGAGGTSAAQSAAMGIEEWPVELTDVACNEAGLPRPSAPSTASLRSGRIGGFLTARCHL